MLGMAVAGLAAAALTLTLTPVFARLVLRLQLGQYLRVDGPITHHTKRGTPSMGGVGIVLASIAAYFLGTAVIARPPGASALLVMLLMSGLGAIGFLDDLLKVRRRQSLGLGRWAKICGEVAVAVLFGVLALRVPSRSGVSAISQTISGLRDTSWDWDLAARFGTVVAAIVFLIWMSLIVVATSNAVKITDGSDGLAAGAAVVSFGCYVGITFWQYRQACRSTGLAAEALTKCYLVRDPLDLAIIASAITGALIGFLWWNTSPARIFMGSTGSLALGGALSSIAILSRTELLLLLIGGLFVISASSVILQSAYFRTTRGRRLLLMSPLHHHFELKGWAEVTVVVRFWIIGFVLALTGTGLFYLEWTLQ